MWCPIHDFAERFAFYRQTTASSARATYSDSCGTVCRNDIDLVCRLTTNQNAFPPGPFGGERRPRESTPRVTVAPGVFAIVVHRGNKFNSRKEDCIPRGGDYLGGCLHVYMFMLSLSILGQQQIALIG